MRYTDETYDQLARQSYGFNEADYRVQLEWRVLKWLYESNYSDYPEDALPLESIPRKIHQVWIGGELPSEYRRFTESWQRFHPGWEYRLWTDKDAEEFDMVNRDMFEKSNSNGQKSDIFRYEILYKYGGIYIDTDFECLKPFDDLLYLDFFTSSGYTDKVELYIGLIACTPFHPIIEACLTNMQGVHPHNSTMDVFRTTGSFFFTKCFFDEVIKDMRGTVAFPPPFFYPFPNNVRQDPEPYKYVRPFSYAIHHWAVSWLLNKKNR
jgi:mannosyltransferase OCH1-like enzyme